MKKVIGVILTLLLCYNSAFADDFDDCIYDSSGELVLGPPDVCPNTDPNGPLDGGVTFLLGAAALYGAKKLKEKRDGTNDTL